MKYGFQLKADGSLQSDKKENSGRRKQAATLALDDFFELRVITIAELDPLRALVERDKNQAARQPPIHEAQVFDVALPLIGGRPLIERNSLPRIQRAGKNLVAEIDVSGKARLRVIPDFLIRFHAQIAR